MIVFLDLLLTISLIYAQSYQNLSLSTCIHTDMYHCISQYEITGNFTQLHEDRQASGSPAQTRLP